MSNFEAQERNVTSSDNVDNHARAGESIRDQITKEDLINLLPKRVKPDVCIRDEDGYIACGPIVGIERPEIPILRPGFVHPSLDKPSKILVFPSNRMDQASPNQQLEPKESFDRVIPNKKN
jgi:hypothetical protein